MRALRVTRQTHSHAPRRVRLVRSPRPPRVKWAALELQEKPGRTKRPGADFYFLKTSFKNDLTSSYAFFADASWYPIVVPFSTQASVSVNGCFAALRIAPLSPSESEQLRIVVASGTFVSGLMLGASNA